jgi:hypothetical protein
MSTVGGFSNNDMRSTGDKLNIYTKVELEDTNIMTDHK